MDPASPPPRRRWMRWVMWGFFSILLLIILGGVAAYFILRPEPEPLHRDRPLSAWIDNPGELDRAVAMLGPEAIPTLLRWAQGEETPLYRLKFALWTRLPFELAIRLQEFQPRSPQDASARAFLLLQKLGPEAAHTAPIMAQLVRRDDDRDIQIGAFSCLVAFAPYSQEARKAVAETLPKADESMRSIAMLILFTTRQGTMEVAPLVVEELSSWAQGRKTMSVEMALLACDALGPKAFHALPHILKALDDPRLQNNAITALRRFGPNAAPAVPALIEILRANGPNPVKGTLKGNGVLSPLPRVLEALMNIGPAAKAALPEIESLQTHPESSVRVMAAMAKAKITGDPKPAASILFSELQQRTNLFLWKIRGQTRGTPAVTGITGEIPAIQWSSDVPSGIARSHDGSLAAAWFIGDLGAPAYIAVPDLRDLAKDTSPVWAAYGARALWQLTQETNTVTQIFKDLLQSQEIEARMFAIRALGAMGPAAAAAIPSLELVRTNDLRTRFEVSRALYQITGGASTPR